jgi:hypothetical protein
MDVMDARVRTSRPTNRLVAMAQYPSLVLDLCIFSMALTKTDNDLSKQGFVAISYPDDESWAGVEYWRSETPVFEMSNIYNVDRLESFRVHATDIDHGNDYPSLHSALPVTTRF